MLFNTRIKTCTLGDSFFGLLDCFSSDICFLIVGCCKSLRFFSFGSLSLLHLSGVWRMVKEKVNKINLFWIQCFWFVHFSSAPVVLGFACAPTSPINRKLSRSSRARFALASRFFCDVYFWISTFRKKL